MPVKDTWISGNEAAEIATRNSGHPVSSAYIRFLAKQGKIGSRAKNGREKEYSKNDVDKLVVEGKGKNRAASAGPTVREQRDAKRQAEQSAA